MNLWPTSSGKTEAKFEKCHMKLQDPQWNILVGGYHFWCIKLGHCENVCIATNRQTVKVCLFPEIFFMLPPGMGRIGKCFHFFCKIPFFAIFANVFQTDKNAYYCLELEVFEILGVP